jgi:serine 3-dehydrogenase
MVARDEGHIVNIGSIAGHVVYPGGNVYNATKFAVRALNEAMSIDLVGTSIKVSSIDPGATETEFSEVRFHGDKERAKSVYEGFEPLRGDDIADAVFYVVNTPRHVNVADMVVLPTAQRNPYVVHVEGASGRKI